MKIRASLLEVFCSSKLALIWVKLESTSNGEGRVPSTAAVNNPVLQERHRDGEHGPGKNHASEDFGHTHNVLLLLLVDWFVCHFQLYTEMSSHATGFLEIAKAGVRVLPV